MERYILTLDQGTGSSKAIVFDTEARQVASFQRETTLLFPRQGWVEQNAMKIWLSVRSVLSEAVASVGEGEIVALGLTNQRETTIVWDALSGRPICNAIVWQDRRTSEYCDQIRAHGLEEMVRQKTGLIVDAYFSATKIRWILDNVPGAMAKARAGRLRFGTMDSWLVWNLTGGKVHVTDVTNASRTMLFNINTLQWDSELLNLFGIPESMLPEVCDSAGIAGETEVQGRRIPIAGIIGDQQSALFGQMCVEEGAVKNTYGTGCFLLMNCGHKPVFSENRLLTTVAFLYMMRDGVCSLWVVALILAREFAVSGVRMLAASSNTVIAANMWGKVKTVLQMLTILFYFFAAALAGPTDVMAVSLISSALCWLVALATVVSGGIYLWQNRACFMQAK